MTRGKVKNICLWAAFGALLFFSAHTAQATSRIKDLADFEGVRENQLVGYGLVVGLNGTGDNIKSVAFTKESLLSMLDRVGINSRDGQLKSKNVAAVIVTGNLPAFGREGSRIDVMVSALGDAKSLQGGTLIATPLVGADGEVYAVAQGPIAVGGYSAAGNNQCKDRTDDRARLDRTLALDRVKLLYHLRQSPCPQTCQNNHHDQSV